MTSKAEPTTGMISIYSGRDCLGRVMARGRFGFQAFDVDDKSLGLFSTQIEAMAALSAAAS
jgi:hypothetical protein